jgi:mono/diheme cytochrome c family protein
VEETTMSRKITGLMVMLIAAAGINGCSKHVTYADVAPIFQQRCAECHTPGKEGTMKSGFSVESYETVMKGTKLGPVIVKGSSESSSLYRLVAGETDPSIHMPHGKASLTHDQIKTIETWIDQGAVK